MLGSSQINPQSGIKIHTCLMHSYLNGHQAYLGCKASGYLGSLTTAVD